MVAMPFAKAFGYGHKVALIRDVFNANDPVDHQRFRDAMDDSRVDGSNAPSAVVSLTNNVGAVMQLQDKHKFWLPIRLSFNLFF